jgi:ComF family protein
MRSSSLDLLARAAAVGVALVGELVAPTRCAACEERVGPRVLFCEACGASVLPPTDRGRTHDAVFEYGGAVATAIARFKYAGRSDLAGRFSGIMAARAHVLAPPGVDLVVPVPLHPWRLVERGFDQAALLSAPIARQIGVEHGARALLRTRATPPQASLDRAARSGNVANAFRCASPASVAGRRVLLVDDVRTTGATLSACAEALYAAGVAEVRTLVLASRNRDEKSTKPQPARD